MPYSRIDRQVNYSRFDVAGAISSDQGLKKLIYFPIVASIPPTELAHATKDNVSKVVSFLVLLLKSL
ncbi:hypothetical protein FLA4_11850 [Candidatus Rickettsia kotlanii]|nr:hypothetical protein FLA4_11850 [Candidatus Rickettsia kotlanii]BDU62017.1 hypothetical protein HM2_11850 [Candidatus Rickettsia kotlanii]